MSLLAARALGSLFALALSLCAQSSPLLPRAGERVVLLGNALAETLPESGWFEAGLRLASGPVPFSVRTLGWPADEVALRPRPFRYGSSEENLDRLRPQVLILFFGLCESYSGEKGLAAFEANLERLLARWSQRVFDDRPAPQRADVRPPRLLLVGPPPHEYHGPPLPDRAFVEAHNADLARYSQVMREVAERHRVSFLDLFATLRAPAEGPRWTRNGIHLNEAGHRALAARMLEHLGLDAKVLGDDRLPAIREVVREKHRLWFFRYRAVNGEYIYGRRREPFGTKNFPREMSRLEEMVRALDERLQEMVR